MRGGRRGGRNRNVVTWDECIGVIVSTNLDARSKNNGNGEGRGGRGQGRGSSGGKGNGGGSGGRGRSRRGRGGSQTRKLTTCVVAVNSQPLAVKGCCQGGGGGGRNRTRGKREKKEVQ